MIQRLSAYLDSLIIKAKKTENFENAVFYRIFDGIPVPCEPLGFTVCAGIGKTLRERKFLTIYKKRRRTILTAELEIRVSAATDSQGLSVFCGKLESALCAADPVGIIKSEISPPSYDADLNAVFRKITLTVRIDDAD